MKKILMLVVALMLSGCSTMGGLRNEPLSAGSSREFEGTQTEVLQAAQEAVVAAGLNIEEAFQGPSGVWIIMSKKGGSGWSSGELVRVAVEPMLDNGSVLVRVVTQRRIKTQITAKGDYSGSIFSAITVALMD